MRMNRFHLFKTIIISGISVIVGYAINFLVTPFIVEHIGVDAYGFVSIANSMVGYVNVLAVALTSFIVRYIVVAFHEGDISAANAYYSSSVSACGVFSLALMVVSFIFVMNMEHFLRIPVALLSSVRVLFLIVFANFAVSVISTPFSASIYIKDRMDLFGVVKTIVKVFEAVLLLLLFLSFGAEVWFVAAATFCANVLLLLFNIRFSSNTTKELKYQKKYVSIGRIKNIISNGVWYSLNQLGNLLNSGLDLLISNLMLTGEETGVIAVAKTIETIFITLSQTVSQAFQPRLLGSYTKDNINKFVDELKYSMKINGFFGAVAFAGFFSLGELYFKLWLPTQDSVLLHRLTMVTVFSCVTDSILRPVYYVNTLTLKNKLPCFVTIVGGVINVASMFVLLKFTELRAYSVVATTAVIMVVINLVFNPIYVAKILGIKTKGIYSVLLRHLVACCVLVVVFCSINKIIAPTGWLGLVVTASIMVVLGALIYGTIMFVETLGRKIHKGLNGF